MFALPFIRRRAKGGAGSIPPGTYATLQNVSDAISQLIGGAPDVTLDTIAEIAAYAMNNADTIAAVAAAIANKQDRNAKLTALSALALAADKLIYATGANTLAATDLTAFMRSVLTAQDAAGARVAIGAVGQQDYNTYKDTVATAFANKQDKLEIGEIGRKVVALNPAGNLGLYGQVPVYNVSTGQVVASHIGSYAIDLLATTPSAVGQVSYVVNVAGGYVSSFFDTKPAGRRLVNLDLGVNDYLTGPDYLVSFYKDGSTMVPGVRIQTGDYGKSLLKQNYPGDGVVFYSNGAAQAVPIATTIYSRSAMQAASAQAARAVAGQRASIAANTSNNTQIPAGGAGTELLWTNAPLAVEGYDEANIAIVGGRITTTQTNSMAARCELGLSASGQGDFAVIMELRSADGANVGNENGAPGLSTGGGWKTKYVSFRVNSAGY